MSRDSHVSLTGNVTRDPEIRFTPAQLAVVKFGIAVNKSKKVGDQWEETPHFFDVTCFGSLADNVAESVTKGARVTVTGELEYQTWEDKETKEKRSKVAVVADDVAVSLKWASAVVTRNEKGSNTSGSGSTAAADDDEFWNN